MKNFLTTIVGDKKEWRAMEARGTRLPEDYRLVYQEIKRYVWKAGGIDGIDIFKGLLDLFEEAAASGRPLNDITGPDVAAFCDELLRGKTTYTDTWRRDLNKTISKKLGK